MPLEESVAAFDGLVRAGKVRAVGLSNFAADTVREWVSVARNGRYAGPVALQPHYGLAHRQPFESEYAADCRSGDQGGERAVSSVGCANHVSRLRPRTRLGAER